MKPTQLISYPIDQVSLHLNFRKAKTISPEGIDEMAESILQHGIIQPPPAILVDGLPQVTMGQRRYYGFLRASVLASERQLQTVPWSDASASEALSVLPLLVSDIDERTVMLQQMVENLQREDVSLRDESEGYAYLQSEHEMTLEEIALRIGKSKQRVSSCIKLRLVPEELWEAYEAKKLSAEHLVLVGRVPHEKDRLKLAKTLLTPKYNGALLSREELTSTIRNDYVIALRGCEWKLTDAELVTVQSDEAGNRCSGGACNSCPCRSANDPELAEELQVSNGGAERGGKAGIDPNLCLNPTCYGWKQEASWKRLKATAKEEGVKVVEDGDSKGIFESWGGLKADSGYVMLDNEPDYWATGAHGSVGVIEGKEWADLIDSKDAKKLTVVCRHPKTKKIVRLIERETAIVMAETKLKERLGNEMVSPFAHRPKPKLAVSPEAEKKKTEADKRKRERESKVDGLTNKMIWEGISDGLRTKTMTDAMLKNGVRQAFALATFESSDLVFKVCGLDGAQRGASEDDWAEIERHIAGDIDKSDKAAGYIRWMLLLLSIAEAETLNYGGHQLADGGVAVLMKALRVDGVKLREKATETVKAQEKEVARGEAEAKKPKGKPDGMGSGETASGAAAETVYDAAVTVDEAAIEPTAATDEMASLKAAKAALKKPKEAEGKEAYNAWSAERMRINRALKKLGH